MSIGMEAKAGKNIRYQSHELLSEWILTLTTSATLYNWSCNRLGTNGTLTTSLYSAAAPQCKGIDSVLLVHCSLPLL